MGVGLTIFFVSGSSEKNLEKLLKDMGSDFYENFYYEQTGKTDEEKKSFLSKYTTVGIKINLTNLALYNDNKNKEIIEENFINKKSDNICDEEETKVIIYPKQDYKKSDYDIEVILKCGFEKEEENKEK